MKNYENLSSNGREKLKIISASTDMTLILQLVDKDFKFTIIKLF